MASTFGRCSLVLIPLTIWLLVKASVDVCPRGDLTVRPFLVIPLGSSVNISCSLKPKQGCSDPNFNQLILYQAEHRINTQRGHLLSSQVKGLPLGTTLFICKLTCNRREERQVCGAEVFVGVTPEEPRSLSCMQSGKHGTVACTWDRGRNTHLITVYTLQLNGPRNLTWQKQCNNPNCDHMDLGINLASEAPEFNYTAKVTATNKLGRASSLPSTFTFSDIVRPLPPWDLSIQYVNGTASKCLLQWRDEEMVQLNRLRYRPHHSRSWNMVNATNAKGRYDLLDLKPFTGYEIQISSKLHLYKGSWSNWSKTLQTQTPEEEPTGMLDVWYMKQDIDHKRQQISLFWKNLSISEARGQILHYEVTLQDETGEEPPQESTTKHTSWSTMVPRTGHWAATVSAVNSKGISLPTRISITDLCGVEWLAPRQVSAHSEGTDTIMVTWEAPDNATSSVQEYVVEWQELWPKGDIPTLDWLRSSPYNRSAGISESLKPFVCYKFRVHAQAGYQRGCGSSRADIQSKAPRRGPHIHSIAEEKGHVFISWDGIPAEDQMGCILHYRIYWQEQDSRSQPHLQEFPYQDSPNSHPIDSLQPQVTYILWMTALTAAGESPQGNKREFRLQGKVRWILLVASGICIAILIAGICSVRRFRQKAFVLLTTLRPQWWSREIPDPANSSWAKIHPTVEETTLLQATCLLTGWLTCEEPEPLVINEVLSQATSTHRHPQCPNLPEKRQEIQNHCTPEDRVYDAPSSAPSGGLTTEAGELVELYKMLGCRGPDSKPGDPPSPLTILPVGYLPTQEGYLPSNIADHPAQAAPTTDSPEQGPQHISLSIFPSISLHPLPLSYGEKLTLDQLKMRRDSLVL
ncbi:interleukin-12 receptor subunit beta-2 isoform X1 [Suncus etruscus]|uniref:interleukin-12 receptor subunit beta-2 isoform X1 n=1 Tax=Suncus etruscus TaxID=109475 RepID=UPI002110869E|nr:interleukin-12 receptor subunit beta-2 isoform X1 [Suncus etruscus]